MFTKTTRQVVEEGKKKYKYIYFKKYKHQLLRPKTRKGGKKEGKMNMMKNRSGTLLVFGFCIGGVLVTIQFNSLLSISGTFTTNKERNDFTGMPSSSSTATTRTSMFQKFDTYQVFSTIRRRVLRRNNAASVTRIAYISQGPAKSYPVLKRRINEMQGGSQRGDDDSTLTLLLLRLYYSSTPLTKTATDVYSQQIQHPRWEGTSR